MIQNYVGMPSLSGCELSDALESHLKDMDIEITEARVNSVVKMGDIFMVSIGNDFFETKGIFAFSGKKKKLLQS